MRIGGFHCHREARTQDGGGMRQVGVLAAAGLVALDEHVDRLADDHDNARRLAEGLAGIAALEVDPSAVQTNMVFVNVRGGDAESFSTALGGQNIVIPAVNPMRLVTHLDVSREDVARTIEVARSFFSGGARRAS